MIDRPARNKMAQLIERYLHEEIAAFQFDDDLCKIRDETEDATVEEVAFTLWFYYDDLKDHKVIASREDWDFFQRRLLLLRSDGRLETFAKRRWTARQFVACLCLALFALAWAHYGFNGFPFLAGAPLGVVSMLLYSWRKRADKVLHRPMWGLAPFSSVAELYSVRRRVPAFRKEIYPIAMRNRSVRSVWDWRIMWLVWGFAWLMFSPIVLVLQVLPEKHFCSRVVTS